jgi:hypothetical protein
MSQSASHTVGTLARPNALKPVLEPLDVAVVDFCNAENIKPHTFVTVRRITSLLMLAVCAFGCRTNQTSLSNVSQTPVATPVATPRAYGVTRKAYDTMKEGMTKDRCDEIIGFSGEIYKTYRYPAGSGLGSGGYFVRWRKGSSEIAAQFLYTSNAMKTKCPL